jgi:hypothetical protein
MALVHQTANQAQFFDLLKRVTTFTVGVPARDGEAIATLPNPQGVLANASVTLDGGNREC